MTEFIWEMVGALWVPAIWLLVGTLWGLVDRYRYGRYPGRNYHHDPNKDHGAYRNVVNHDFGKEIR